MIDFLILYEHKARELENCVYLAEALKKRGHSVRISSMLSFKRKTYKPRVIVTPHLYDENQARYYTTSIWKGNRPRVVSMQYEQVLNIAGRKTQIHRPKGYAKKAFHVAWGENERNEYLSNGIKESNILEVGSISMDFDTNYFSSYLPTKDEVAQEFNIPLEKKWCIFFSSFAYCGRSDENLNRLPNKNNAYRLREIMEKTKPVILAWFEAAIKDNPNLVFIYRKHPAEDVGNTLKQLIVNYPKQFYEISEHSIRPWIHVSDYCCTWFSTSSIDAFFAGKPCAVLRPYPLDDDLEVEVMYDMNFIVDEKSFLSSLKVNDENDNSFKRNIERFFINRRNHLQISDYVNAFECVLKDKNKENEFLVIRESFRSEIIENFLGVICDLCKYMRVAPLFRPFSKKLFTTISYYEKEVYGVNKEINNLKRTVIDFLNSIQ